MRNLYKARTRIERNALHGLGREPPKRGQPYRSPPRNIRYYPLQRHWTKKIVPHLGNRKLNDTLVENFNKFTFGRWHQRFTYGQTPFEFESCDWWCEHRGPMPRYWQYVKHAACHWTANWILELAQLVEPKRRWRIITSEAHSTVWDGAETLFDFNFQAMGITPGECFKAAARHPTSRELKPGQHERIYFAEHYSVDMQRAKLAAKYG
jgi:hypothetical protein